MKRRQITSLLVLVAILFSNIYTAWAVACKPRWNGTRTVEATCDFSSSARIYGDIIVWPYTVTVPTWVVLWINLSTNKATFTTWKILFTGTAKMDGSVSNRYTYAISYSYVTNVWITDCANGSCTACWNGANVLNPGQTWFAGSTPIAVGSSGTIYCAYP